MNREIGREGGRKRGRERGWTFEPSALNDILDSKRCPWRLMYSNESSEDPGGTRIMMSVECNGELKMPTTSNRMYLAFLVWQPQPYSFSSSHGLSGVPPTACHEAADTSSTGTSDDSELQVTSCSTHSLHSRRASIK